MHNLDHYMAEPSAVAVAPPVSITVGQSATFLAKTVSSISVVPSSAAGQVSVELDDGAAVTLAAGVAFDLASGHPAVKLSTKLKFNVLAGTVVIVAIK